MALLDDVLMAIFGFSGFSSLVAWPIFCFLSMRPIEAKVRAEGRDRTGWDGVGGRVVLYAVVLALPVATDRMKRHPLIDVEAVRQHATARDRRLAEWFTVSVLTMTVSGVLASILF